MLSNMKKKKMEIMTDDVYMCVSVIYLLLLDAFVSKIF